MSPIIAALFFTVVASVTAYEGICKFVKYLVSLLNFKFFKFINFTFWIFIHSSIVYSSTTNYALWTKWKMVFLCFKMWTEMQYL